MSKFLVTVDRSVWHVSSHFGVSIYVYFTIFPIVSNCLVSKYYSNTDVLGEKNPRFFILYNNLLNK